MDTWHVLLGLVLRSGGRDTALEPVLAGLSRSCAGDAGPRLSLEGLHLAPGVP